MNNKAYAVPLHELLAGVPRGARLEITDLDGMGTRFIPVGRYCHEAAEILRAKLNKPEKEVMQMALDAIEAALSDDQPYISRSKETVEALRFRLAQPEKEWVGLTDEELLDLADMAYANDLELLQTLQVKLKEKNT